MSVSDPLIRELKGYTSTFLKNCENRTAVTDEHKSIIFFENCLENIFYYGSKTVPSLLGFVWSSDPWTWIEKMSKNSVLQDHLYHFNSVIEEVKNRANLFTNLGRFRLFIRYCLVRKCLHCPIEYLWSSGKCEKYYASDSIIGDEILVEIFLSVLYQIGKLPFKLDLEKSSLLDYSWELPEMLLIEVVPTKNLGISVTFSGNHAIILRIRSNSVISEYPEICIGDIVESMNGVQITSAMRGRFGAIMKSQRAVPILLSVVKAFRSPIEEAHFHASILKLYKDIEIDPEYIRSRIINRQYDASEFTFIKKKRWAGFKLVYMGNVHIGRSGDVRAIDKAFSTLMSSGPTYQLETVEKKKIDVMFEVGELGVKFSSLDGQEIIEEHSFMEISACGGVTLMPNYLSYIAGKEYCNVCKNFKCYVFLAPTFELAQIILQGIGQGFQRTHYAV